LVLVLLGTLSCIANGPGKGRRGSVSIGDFLQVSGNQGVSIEPFEDLIAHFEKRQKVVKSERDFVRHIFIKTHSQILKRYRQEAEFQQLFDNGTYNCLTGTILYSLIFDHFNIKHEVIETNYHIFMMVQTEQGEVLIEATDPLNGFVYVQKEIDKRVELYKNNITPGIEARDAYEFTFSLYNSVSHRELLGLLYYNKAVELYNKQRVEKSIEFLIEASSLYTSVRIKEFAGILLFTVGQGEADDQLNQQYIKSLQMIRSKSSQVVAGI
jgi:hypothetical protein